MSAESRRDWLMTHPTLGVAIMTTAITAFAVPFAVIALASSGANGALGVAGVSIGLGWLAGFVYGNILIRRQGAGRDWRPPSPSVDGDGGDFRVTDPVRAERDAGRHYILAAALRDPRFAGFCALATSIAAMNAVVPGHESIVARCAKFIVTALLLATFFLLLTIATPRTEEESRTAGRRARNSMFALAAVFVAMSVLVAILR